jgi:hypothetical protein
LIPFLSKCFPANRGERKNISAQMMTTLSGTFINFINCDAIQPRLKLVREREVSASGLKSLAD